MGSIPKDRGEHKKKTYLKPPPSKCTVRPMDPSWVWDCLGMWIGCGTFVRNLNQPRCLHDPKNPDSSRKFVGLMVETSHPQNRIVGEIPDS